MSTLPNACVVDANVVMRLFVPGAYMHEVQEYFAGSTEGVHAPDLLTVECTNALWKYVRAGQYQLDQARQDLLDLFKLDIRWTATGDMLPGALEIAAARDITAYDACYVALAEHLQLPLLTADNKLAAKLAGSPHIVLTLDNLLVASN